MGGRTELDSAVSARWVVPVNGDSKESNILPNHTVGIKDGKIACIEPTLSFTAKYTVKGDHIMRTGDSVLIPGLINMHTHLPMSPIRAMFEDLPLLPWLNKVMPMENLLMQTHKDAERFLRIGTEMGVYESLINGVTFCNDMYYHHNIVLDTAERLGFRVFTPPDIQGCSSPEDPEKALKDLVAILDDSKRDKKRKLTKVIAGFHGCYTCSKDRQQAIISAANRNDLLFHTHLHESKGELAMFKASDGCTAIERLNELGALNERALLAHCVQLTDDEIRLFAEKKVNVVHNPRSNMKLGSGICRVKDLLDAGVNVTMGTDSSSSNNSLSLLSDMQYAALLCKLHTGDPSSLGAYTLLKMATINGAKALRMSDKIGSIEIGKEADLTMFDLNPDGHHFPIICPLDHLLYTNFAKVTDVFIQGVCKVKQGTVQVPIDWEEQKVFVQEMIEKSSKTKLTEAVNFG